MIFKNLLLTLSLMALSATAQTHQSRQLENGWFFSGDDGSTWQSVTIPHDWAIAGPFDKKWDLQVVAIKENGEETATEHSGRSGSLPWLGRGIYRTSFAVPANAGYAELIFDGAMSEPVVLVNGREAGHWAYGYNAFRVDVLPFIHRDGTPNELEVRLANVEESSRWYPGGGLYRPVTLVTGGRIHLDAWGHALTTVSANDDLATVSAETRVDGLQSGEKATVEIVVFDANNKECLRVSSPVDDEGVARNVLKVMHPVLWSPESPYRYNIVTNVKVDGKIMDARLDKFGIRDISFTAEHGFMLNGVPRKIKGVCLHHDLGPLGAAVNRAAIERQILMMKEMGADAIRTSHNMPSSLQMEVCDSLGMMVMAESFDGWKDPKVKNGYNRFWDEWWQKDITNLILNHRNHCSIIMWSVGNEIPEQWKPEGAERYRGLVDLCHSLDPSRPVTCGMDNPDADIESAFAFQADVPGFNYRVHRYEACFPKLPQGLLLGSETASTVSSRGEYFFPDTAQITYDRPNGQCTSYDIEHCWWSNLPDDDWRVQDDLPWTIGEFVWTGFDYLGEPTPYDAYWPSRSSYYGIVDLAGIPKDRYYLYRSHWNKDAHTIHLLPHWTWPGREGQVTPVYCYTDYPSAELFVNGKSQGRITKNDTTRLDRYRLRWRDVKYEPGEVKVVVYDADGKKAGEQVMRTAGKPAQLSLTPDRTTYFTRHDNLAFITVALTDADGTLCPDATDLITVTSDGGARFKAICNGDATSTEVFTEPRMHLFHGMLVVVVALPDTAGDCSVTVATESGLRKTISLRTINR